MFVSYSIIPRYAQTDFDADWLIGFISCAYIFFYPPTPWLNTDKHRGPIDTLWLWSPKKVVRVSIEACLKFFPIPKA